MTKLSFYLTATLFLTLAPFALSVVDTDGLSMDIKTHPYLGRGRGNTRAPCPFLNTAANHNMLPYSGRNIPYQTLDNLLTTLGMGSMAVSFLVNSLKDTINKSDLFPGHSKETFDLSDVNVHGHPEHDVSLTRWDVKIPQQKGDNQRAPELVNGLLAMAKKRPGEEDQPAYLDAADISEWRRNRYDQEIARGHEPSFGIKDQLLAAGECAFIAEILGRNGKITVDTARSILMDERFPDDWVAPGKNFNILRLNKVMLECAAEYHMPNALLERIGGHQSWFSLFSWASNGYEANEDGCDEIMCI